MAHDTKQAQHTPWTFSHEGVDRFIRNAQGEAIVSDTQYYPWVDFGEDEGWAAVVRAVNCHEELVAALKLALYELENAHRADYLVSRNTFDVAREAIAHAEARP